MITYIKGASLPEPGVAWLDSNGNLINFASGWTFTLKIGLPGRAAELTKTSGLTGGSTAPHNVLIDWTSTELDTLGVGWRLFELFARNTALSQSRAMQDSFMVLPAVT